VRIEVRNQVELDAALAALKPNDWIVCFGNGYFDVTDSATVTAYGSATVTAYDSATVTAYDSATVTASGSATVTAYGSATVRAYDSATVTAYGSATVRASDSATVTASDSATVTAYDSATVTAYDSATVTASGSATVTAYGSATVTAYDSATVRAYGASSVRPYAGATVVASKHSTIIVRAQDRAEVAIDGGHIVELPAITTAEEWCEFYGVVVVDGVATLFKAVRDDYRSGRGFLYAPGSTPEAPDWDGGKEECGGGLHFCGSPHEAKGFDYGATRFMACPVRLSDIAVHQDADYPHKVKARGCCAPVYECDADGRALRAAAQDARAVG